MAETDHDDATVDAAELEAFFAAGRAGAVEPSAAFLARVLADAEAVQAGFAAPLPSVREAGAATRGGLAARLRRALGGWGAAGGLATAAAAGLWFGMAAGGNLTLALTAGLAGTGAEAESAALLDLLPDDGGFALAALDTAE